MASREARRIRDRIAGKSKEDEKGGKTISKLTIPSIIIIGLVLIGLLWWGGSSKTGGHVSVTFGAYEGRPIVWSPGNYFARQVAILQEAANNSGQKLDSEAAVRALIPYMIFHTAAMLEAEKNGLTVSDTEVEDYIKSSGYLERYNKAEAMERHNLFEVFKEQILELKVLQPLVQSYNNKALENNAASMGSPERKFKYVQWKYDDYPMQEITKFAVENKDLFRSIKLSRIVAKTESEAKDAHAKITSRQSTFDEQVRSVSKGEGSPELDWQSYYNLQNTIGSKEAADKIFALKQGEISDVITFGGQWLIYRCDKEAVPADLSSEKTINEIKTYILQFQKGRIETYFETEANKFLESARKSGLAQASAGAKLTVFETGYFPINYDNLPFLNAIPDQKDPFSTSIKARPQTSLASFFKETFGLKKGALSKPILLDDQIIICELADERTPAAADLEKAKERFRNASRADALNFYYFIADRLFLQGSPVVFTGQGVMSLDPVEFHQYLTMGIINPRQVMFNASPDQIELDKNRTTRVFYSAFVDLSKMGPRADREEQIAAGFEAYRKLFSAQEK